MNNKSTCLKDLIHIERKIIPDSICDSIVKEIEQMKWLKHSWYSSTTKTSHSEESRELDIQKSNPEQQKILTEYLVKSFNNYCLKYKFNSPKTETIINQLSGLRFNRYSPSQIMRQHHDHISSLFDGKERGIPVLSFVLNFNEDYEGGNLYFWDDYFLDLAKGDIVIFPSLFLFPHGVSELKKGIRYSGVCWGW